jgi:hypothetical protein
MHPLSYIIYAKKGNKNGPERNPVARELKWELYFRRRTKAHHLESVAGLQGGQISPLRVSKELLKCMLGLLRRCSGHDRAVLRVAHPRLRLSGRCSHPQTKTEPAKEKINAELLGIFCFAVT